MRKLFKRKLQMKSGQSDIEVLKQQKFKQKYFGECRFIWKKYIPEYGQSSVLQGELLRQIEKLRGEAQNNGNINWDDDFAYFCNFIRETLCNQTIYTDEEKRRIELVMAYIKDCGEYAGEFYAGKISDDDLDIEKIAYTGDNLYDMIADAVGFFQSRFPDPIPFAMNGNVKR